MAALSALALTDVPLELPAALEFVSLGKRFEA